MVFVARANPKARSRRADPNVAASVDRHARTIAALRAAIAVAHAGDDIG